MYLKKKIVLLIAVFIFIGFMSCETPTNYQNETTTYNKSIKLDNENINNNCLLYTSPSPRDAHESRMPSSA